MSAIVAEVTDDKSLPKDERKRLQEEHAPGASFRAQQVKLADKIANLRDLAKRPPATWDLARKRAYFDWCKRVVDGLRGRHAAPGGALRRRPTGPARESEHDLIPDVRDGLTRAERGHPLVPRRVREGAAAAATSPPRCSTAASSST